MIPVWVAAVILYLTLAVLLVVVFLGGHAKTQQALHPDRNLISAYKSQPWWSLGCSFLAAAFGASALVANPEAGATAGWLSVFSYGLANALPYWILIWIGPKLQSFLKMDGFTMADFVLVRFGRIMHLLTTMLSVFFLFIWLSAELSSLTDCFGMLVPDFRPVLATCSVVVITATYALFAGFKASILTDRFQAGLAAVIVVTLLGGVLAAVDAPAAAWKLASRFEPQTDITASLVLILSTTVNQFLDLGSWQRVFSSETPRDARLGLISAGTVNFLLQSTMTAMGTIAMAAVFAGQLEIPEGEEYLSFFHLLQLCPTAFTILALILTIVLASSTIDSLQNSLAAALGADLLRQKQSLHWARLFSISLTIPAVILAVYNKSVLSLFLLSNIFSAAIIPPIFLGLSAKLATSRSALIGTVLGIVTIFVVGWSVEGTFVGGLKWPLFPKGLAHWSTLFTFALVPIVSAGVTMLLAVAELRRAPMMLDAQVALLRRIGEPDEVYDSPSSAYMEYTKQSLHVLDVELQDRQ